jgi:hypothetical protein
MSRRTNFLVQAFDPEAEDEFKPGGLIVSRTAEGARRTAERVALSKAGVVVSSTISNAESGAHGDQPIVFFRAPAECDLMQ